MDFDVGEYVYFKVSPSKGITRFGKRGKLNSRYVGPYLILDRVGPVAYWLELPQELTNVHNVFHISMLRRCVSDGTPVIELELVEIGEDMTYIEHPVQILDKKDQVLQNKTIPLVKVLWRNHSIEEATWERGDEIRKKYPHLFDS